MGEGTEECDDEVETDGCDFDCTLAICGDSYINALAGENCDDGNDESGDGCSDTCRLENCGNGEVDAGEACDDQSPPVNSDSCPNDGDNGGTCQPAECGDGIVWNTDGGTEVCDEFVATATCDDDCTPVECGDGVVNAAAGETCDGGADLESPAWDGCAPPDSAPDKACKFIPRAFRFNLMEIVSPHIEAPTEEPLCEPVLIGLLNGGITSATKTDSIGIAAGIADPDCLIDLGFVVELDKPDQEDGATIDGTFGLADCTTTKAELGCAIEGETPCSPSIREDLGEVADLTFRVSRDDDCLATTAGHIPAGLEGSDPAWPVDAGDNGCIVSDPTTIDIALGSAIRFNLQEAQVSARYNAAVTRLQKGMIRGFLSEEDAASVVVSAVIGIFPTLVLPELLPNACGDADIGPGGEAGWWFYLTFRGIEVPWEGGLLCGNGVVDEGEICDPGLEGSCDEFTTCEDDDDVCTMPVVVAGDPCNPQGCNNIAVTVPDDGGDTCCPDKSLAVQAEDPNCPNYDPDLRPDLD